MSDSDPLDVMMGRVNDLEREIAERPIRSHSLTFRLICQLWEEQEEWFARFPAEVVLIATKGCMKEALRALGDIETAAIQEVGPFADYMRSLFPEIKAALAEYIVASEGVTTVNRALRTRV